MPTRFVRGFPLIAQSDVLLSERSMLVTATRLLYWQWSRQSSVQYYTQHGSAAPSIRDVITLQYCLAGIASYVTFTAHSMINRDALLAGKFVTGGQDRILAGRQSDFKFSSLQKCICESHQLWRCVYRASYCNVLMTNEMHSPYNQFYSTIFCLLYMFRTWAGIATRYGLDGPGIESRWGRDFPHPSRPALGPTQPPVQWLPGLSRG